MWGVTALLLIDADVLPYNYTEYGAQLENFYDSTLTLLKVCILIYFSINLKQYDGNLDLTVLYDSVINFQNAAAKVAMEIKNKDTFSEAYLEDLNDK
jgi:hypothetical protein